MYKHAKLTIVALLFATVLTTVVTTDLTNGNTTLEIQRGRTADLSPALLQQGYHFPGEGITDRCMIRVSGPDSQRCGTIRPNLFPCKMLHNSSVIYTHGGCFDNKHLIRLAVLRNGRATNIQLTVRVVDSTHPLSAIGNSLEVSARPLAGGGDTFAIQLKFPARWQDACSYSLVMYPGILPLPQFGRLGGPVNEFFSCGYYPMEPVTYTRTLQTNFTDHVIIQLHAESVADSVRVLLPLPTAPAAQPPGVPSLPPISFNVYHTGLSPLDPWIVLASIPVVGDFRMEVEGSGGSFVTHDTPLDQIHCSNISIFTDRDLVQGAVAFLPCLSPASPPAADFQCRVLDNSGTLLTTTTITVHLVDPLTSVTPLQLTLASDALDHVQVTILDAIEIALNDSCSHWLQVEPRVGYLEWVGLEDSLNSSLDRPFGLTQEELLTGNLSYQRTVHHRHTLQDHFQWETRCPRMHPLLMAILLSYTGPDLQPPTVDFSVFELVVFAEFASQLNGVMLQSSDPDSNIWGTLYQVLTEDGRFVVSHMASERAHLHILQRTLETLPDASPVTSFTQEQLDCGAVWYLPSREQGNTSLLLRLLDASHNVQPELVHVRVRVSHKTPETTDNQILSVIKPLELSPLQLTPFQTSATITSHHLRTDGLSADYILLSPPLNGRLCLGDVPCTESVADFTQSDVDSGLLQYHPTEKNFSVDAFRFLLTGSVSILQWFVIHRSLLPLEAALQSVSQGSSPVVEAGGSTPLTEGLLGEWEAEEQRAVEITVVSPPKHGELSLEGIIPLANLSNVTYTHSGRIVCSDQMLLAVLVGGVTKELTVITIIVTQPQHFSLVFPNPITISQPSIALSEHNILILSDSTCANTTFLHITKAPRSGALLLDVRDDSQDVLVLEQGSRFSLESLQLSAVGYSLHPHLASVETINDSLSFTVPLVTGNQEHVLPIQYARSASQPPYQVSLNPPNSLHVGHIGDGAYGVVLTPSVLQASVLPVPAPKMADISLIPPTLLQGYRRGVDSERLTPLLPIVPLEDLHRAELLFKLQETPLNVTEEVLHVSVTVNTSHLGAPVVSDAAIISLKWAYVFFELAFLPVKEEKAGEREVTVTVRRVGHTDINATVDVTTMTGNATIQCTHTGDVCATNSTLKFAPGSEVAEYTFTINSDLLVEGAENFFLQLAGGVGVVPHSKGTLVEVIILDSAAPPTMLEFALPGAHPSRTPSLCDTEITVPEDIGTLSLPILQRGSITEAVGVICYTETGSNGIQPNIDFVPRPNHSNSLVLFDQYSAVASCDVQIVDDQVHERDEFLVVSLGVTIGATRVDTQADKICVYVTNDVTTTSVTVGFGDSSLTAMRNLGVAVFTIIRTGSAQALSQPTVVYFNISSNGSAVEGVDFILPQRAVTFGPNSTSVEGVVVILEHSGVDLQQRSFQISLTAVENGSLGTDGRLLTVVIISSQTSIVQFRYSEGKLAENVPEKLISVVRHGNQNITSHIRCIQSNTTATLNGTHLQTHSEDIRMEPGQSEAFCRLRIIDDNIWEGNSEVVFLTIVPLDEHTIGGNQTTFRGSVLDREDIPTVQFASPRVREKEPLSHYSVDARNVTVTLTRSGDPTQLLIVEFWTGSGDSDDMGVANLDYQSTSGTVEFPPGVMSAHLHVALLANHQRQHDFTFLVYIRKPASASLPLIGSVNVVVVEVLNHNILGPFFPDRPRVVSSQHPRWQEKELSAYTPLLCVTPCDEEWTGNEAYKQECQDQNIVHQRTKYTWEMKVISPGLENQEFLQFGFENILAPPNQRYLPPVHMYPDRYVRCRVTAVDSSGIEGYTRVSRPIKLVNKSQDACPPKAKVSVTATLALAGDGTPTLEDYVSLTLSRIPHLENLLPLLSTVPFPQDVTPLLTHRPSRQHHQCSSLAVGEFHSLTGADGSWQVDDSLALYKHLDKISCQWTFTSHHRLQDLLDVCGGTIAEKAGPGNLFTVSIPLYLSYVSFGTNFAVPDPARAYSASTTATLQLSLPTVPPPLRSPLQGVHNYSHNASLEVVSVGVRNNQLEVLLQTSLNADGRVFTLSNSFASAESGISLALDLLQTSSPRQPVVQLWKMSARSILSDYSGSYHVELVNCVMHPQYRSYCVPQGKVDFQFQIEKISTGSGYLAGVVPDIALRSTSSGAVFNEGEVIEVSVGILQSQLLHQGLRVAVTRAIICQDRNRHSHQCEARAVEVASAGGGRRARGVALDNRTVLSNNTFTFNTSGLTGGMWYIDTRYVIANGSEVVFPVSKDSVYSVSKEFFVAEHSIPTPTVTTPTPRGESQAQTSVAANVSFGLSVAITVAIVVVIVVITIVLCLLRKGRRTVYRNQLGRGRPQNVKVTMTKLNNGEERIVYSVEMVQAPNDTTSLPEGVCTQRTRSRPTPSLGDSSPATTSHRSLPTVLPSRNTKQPDELEKETPYEHVIHIEDDKELVENAEALFAAIVRTPPDSRNNVHSNV